MIDFRAVIDKFLCGVCVVLVAVPSTRAADPPAGSLEWYADHARAANELEVRLPPPKVLEAEIGDLSSVARRSSIVIVDFVEQCTSHSTYDIETWTKYKIRERLGRYQVVAHNRTASVADCLAPFGENEFAVAEPFGTVQIKGVAISRSGFLHAGLKSKRRLMFVQFIGDGSLAFLPFGQKGEFSISADGYIRSSDKQMKNPLADDLENCCRNSLSKFLTVVQGTAQTGAAE